MAAIQLQHHGDTKSERLTLPLIAATASAREALELMRAHQRSGVIVMAGDGSRLYIAAPVVVTFAADPLARLIDIPASWLPPAVTQSGSEGNVVPAAAMADITFESDRLDTDIAALSAAPRDCYCRADLKPVAGGRTGGDCPDGHHGTVRCV